MSTPTPKNDGGPAFPAQDWQAHGNHHPGMSLRDWFAGQALVAFMSSELSTSAVTKTSEAEKQPFDHYIAGMSYELADAMLQAREARLP